MQVLAIIPARGGSKGIPRPNVVEICSKPLVVHSIEHALAAEAVDRVIVSTEDEEIAETARRHGAEVPCHFTDEKRYLVSESSVYRLLNAHDLSTSSAYVMMSASDSFNNLTRRVHELWQTDFMTSRESGVRRKLAKPRVEAIRLRQLKSRARAKRSAPMLLI